MLQKAKSADNEKRKLFNSINVPDDDAPALPLPRIGVGLFDANRVEGKVATNFDVGDIIHVEYIGDGLMKGSKFTGQVGKYYRSSVKRSKGIVLYQGGELMVEITWRDAPSQFAKSCVGKADKFKVDDFLVDYKVRKIERIAISNNLAVAAISNSTSSSGKKN